MAAPDLGLAAATAVSIALIFDFSSRGWTAAAALLVMRPLADMVRLRGVGRALATIFGVVVATAVLRLGLSPAATGTAVLILYGNADAEAVRDTSWTRVEQNVIGAGIALFYGLLVPSLARRTNVPTPTAQVTSH
jgi:hypothetical protein